MWRGPLASLTAGNAVAGRNASRSSTPSHPARLSLFDRLHSGRFDREVILDGF
jgi:hypothetical protein